MASISDVFNALNDIKGKLDLLHADNLTSAAKLDQTNARLDTLTASTQDLRVVVDTRLGDLLTQQHVANTLTHHLTRQQETVICLLRQVSENTCALVNLSWRGLAAAEETRESTRAAADVLRTAHPDAALDLQRRTELNRQLLECCPKKEEPEPCRPGRCADPGPFRGQIPPRDDRIE